MNEGGVIPRLLYEGPILVVLVFPCYFFWFFIPVLKFVRFMFCLIVSFHANASYFVLSAVTSLYLAQSETLFIGPYCDAS